MTELRLFHRLFFSTQDEPGGVRRFEVRVSPDQEQAGVRELSTALISCSTLDSLSLCLKELGVDGWSRFVGEGPSGVPAFEYVPCTPDQVLAFLRSDPPSPFDRLTLVAADTPIEEMKRRIESLRRKAGAAIEIRAA